MPHVPAPSRPSDRRSGLLVVDLQEKLLAAMPSGQAVVNQTHRLLDAAERLGIPFAATVQYPRGLGPLDPTLQPRLPDPEEKLDFSAAVCRGALDRWSREGRDQIVVAGIETHVCVEQTVADLLAEGMQVSVVAEAVTARGGEDHEWALWRMQAAGASITTVEAVLFAWCGTADRPEFKAISQIVKRGASAAARRTSPRGG